MNSRPGDLDAAPRLPLVPAIPADPQLAEVFDRIRSRGTEPLNMHRTLAHSPKVFEAYLLLAHALRDSAKVARHHRELVILRTAYLTGGRYELTQHRPMALACGLTPEQVESIGTWERSDAFDELQRALLTYTDKVVAHGRVDDGTFERLTADFDAQELVELTMTAAFYSGAAALTTALAVQLEADAGQTSYGLPPR